MQNYELLYIVANNYTDDEAKKIKEKVDAELTAQGAILGLEELMGKKKLAYPINQSAHGYYFLREFELEDGTKLQSINNYLRLDKEVLRAQIIIKHKLSAEKLEKARKRELSRSKALKEASDKHDAKPAAAVKSDDKKTKTMNLDDKLAEILKTDDLM